MNEYELTSKVTISLYTVVKADSLKEAIEIAGDRDIVKSEWGQENIKNESWVSDEFDGETYDIEEI